MNELRKQQQKAASRRYYIRKKAEKSLQGAYIDEPMPGNERPYYVEPNDALYAPGRYRIAKDIERGIEGISKRVAHLFKSPEAKETKTWQTNINTYGLPPQELSEPEVE